MIRMKTQFIINMNSFLISHNHKDCTGCSACMNVCSHKAITMKEDSEGFLYPSIEIEKCVDCGLCLKVCPMNDNTQKVTSGFQHIFLSQPTCSDHYLHSATIGVCTMLTELFLKNGDYVFGSALDEETWTTKHIGISNVQDVNKIRGSKYFQSDVQNTFSEVKVLLKRKRNVLYIGTPCQIAGLKAFLRKAYENLYTIDLICHGTFSHKFFKKEVEYWEAKYKGKMSNFSFRNKKVGLGGVVSFDMTKPNGNSKSYIWPAAYSPIYRCFTANGDGLYYNLRECCYSCRFHEPERYGDLTAGDAWGIKEKRPDLFDKESNRKGIALLFANSEKGANLLGMLSNYISFVEITREDALSQPALVPNNDSIPDGRKRLYDNLDVLDYESLVESVLYVDFNKLQSTYLKKVRIEKVKKIIKKIIRYTKHDNN